MAEPFAQDPRVHLAAERTLLAWIRTGIAMMGFGFVVARFGLFLREIQAVRQTTALESFGASLWFGTALVLIGVVVNLSAVVQHLRLMRELRQGNWDPNRPARTAIFLALALCAVGLAVTFYLLAMR